MSLLYVSHYVIIYDILCYYSINILYILYIYVAMW